MGTLIPICPNHAADLQASPRPTELSGCLVDAAASPRRAAALLETAGDKLLAHLRAACIWPGPAADSPARIGDYSFYVLELEQPGGPVFVQVWSEPDGTGVLVEASVGAGTESRASRLWRRRTELLRDRGFEFPERGPNPRKTVLVDGEPSLRALARELIALLCQVYGWDGTAPLDYTLHLGTRLQLEPVHADLTVDETLALLRSWGCETATIPAAGDDDQTTTIGCRRGARRWLLLLPGWARDAQGSYAVLLLRQCRTVAADDHAALIARINATVLGTRAAIDADGDLALAHEVLIVGGVTQAYLRGQLDLWLENLNRVDSLLAGDDAAESG